MEPNFDELVKQVKRLSVQLDKQIKEHNRLEPYLVGECPLPPAVTQAKLTQAYRLLMPVAEAPWGSLIVDSKQDRLEVAGITDTNKEAATKIWEQGWHPNDMDSESKLGHAAALLDGRFFATVWMDADGKPDIALDDVTQMVVEFEEGSRRKRVAALRRWKSGGTIYATLYRPDGIYKFQGPKGSGETVTDTWQQRHVADEDWPMENPFGVVNVVEIAINRRLKSGSFPYARGEFAHCTGLLDRINLLTFLGLVVAFWMGFPLRGVTGEKIRHEVLKDDDGNAIMDENTGKEKTRRVPPFDARPDSVAQFENPEAKVFQLPAADRKNLSVFAELDQLSVISKTPRHYFPLEQGMSNLSAEAIMASEGAMHAAVTGHKASMGSGYEELSRLCGMLLGAELSPTASIEWMKHESRSLAEQADAYAKLASTLPWMAAAEIALNVSQEQVGRWQSEAALSPIFNLIDQAKNDPALGVAGS